jgi:type II secretion system protein C
MRTLAGIALAILLGACGGAASPSKPATVAAARPVAPAVPAPLDEHHIARSIVRDVVAQGLGTFLRHVEVADQPVMAGGKFHGFRIAALRDSFWQGVDLKPGDVIVRVNGFPIERPEQAQTAFESLDVSSELRVDYERDGQPRELVYAIVDDR